jgi:hypothetical protein
MLAGERDVAGTFNIELVPKEPVEQISATRACMRVHEGSSPDGLCRAVAF